MIVTDCSALLGFLVDPAGAPMFAEAIAKAGIVAAPELIDVELLSALRRLERLKTIKVSNAAAIIDDYMMLPLVRFSIHDLAKDIWALRHNLDRKSTRLNSSHSS